MRDCRFKQVLRESPGGWLRDCRFKQVPVVKDATKQDVWTQSHRQVQDQNQAMQFAGSITG